MMKVKEESEKLGLQLNIQKTKIMASDPIRSWEIDGETVSDFIFGGSKITADGDCNHEIKRCLLLGRQVNDQPRQHIKKQRYYFANKGSSSQGYGFSCGHVWTPVLRGPRRPRQGSRRTAVAHREPRRVQG